MAYGHNRKVSYDICNHGGLDLIIVNLPKDLHIAFLSNPPHSILELNKHNVRNMEAIFEFGDVYLYNDVAILLFAHESTKVKNDVRTYVASSKCNEVVNSKYSMNGGCEQASLSTPFQSQRNSNNYLLTQCNIIMVYITKCMDTSIFPCMHIDLVFSRC